MTFFFIYLNNISREYLLSIVMPEQIQHFSEIKHKCLSTDTHKYAST